MDLKLRADANAIITASIRAVQPDEAVSRALTGQGFPGRVVLVAAGKAAWQMAKAAYDCLGDRIDNGVVSPNMSMSWVQFLISYVVKPATLYRTKTLSQAPKKHWIWFLT